LIVRIALAFLRRDVFLVALVGMAEEFGGGVCHLSLLHVLLKIDVFRCQAKETVIVLVGRLGPIDELIKVPLV
jgi:hypothetical protein